jgi:hypothetical protein
MTTPRPWGFFTNPAEPTVKAIVAATAEAFGVAPEEITGGARLRRVVRARQMAAHVAGERTTRAIAEIGRRLGCDHTTVLWAQRRMEEMLRVDPVLSARREAICKRLDEWRLRPGPVLATRHELRVAGSPPAPPQAPRRPASEDWAVYGADNRPLKPNELAEQEARFRAAMLGAGDRPAEMRFRGARP